MRRELKPEHAHWLSVSCWVRRCYTYNHWWSYHWRYVCSREARQGNGNLGYGRSIRPSHRAPHGRVPVTNQGLEMGVLVSDHRGRHGMHLRDDLPPRNVRRCPAGGQDSEVDPTDWKSRTQEQHAHRSTADDLPSPSSRSTVLHDFQVAHHSASWAVHGRAFRVSLSLHCHISRRVPRTVPSQCGRQWPCISWAGHRVLPGSGFRGKNQRCGIQQIEVHKSRCGKAGVSLTPFDGDEPPRLCCLFLVRVVCREQDALDSAHHRYSSFQHGADAGICKCYETRSGRTDTDTSQMCINLYLVDTFGRFAASALAASKVLQSIMGAFLPLAGRPLYQHLGLGWGNSVLAFIALAMIPIPWAFFRYGERLRARFQMLS